jgi:hypothetical protein
VSQSYLSWRTWIVPIILVGLAALLTFPWTFLVLQAAYQRDVEEKVDRLAQRVKIHLESPSNWITPPSFDPLRFESRSPLATKTVLDPLRAELLGDNSVRAVCFIDFRRQVWGALRSSDDVPIPQSLDEVSRLIDADPNSYRKSFKLENKNGLAGIIYLDLSIPKLKERFWIVEGPIIRKIGFQTFIAFFVISCAISLAYRMWGNAERDRKRAELEQQGLLAERGLTAAVLAHEIRNPLAALRFQLHSLRRNSADATRVSATADTIDAELMRIQQLWRKPPEVSRC